MKISSLNYFFLVCGLLGVYSYVGISNNGVTIVPASVAALFGILLLLLNRDRLEIVKVKLFMLLVGIALLSILATTNAVDLWDKGRGLLLFVYSIIISYGFYLGLSRLSKKTAKRLFLIVTIFLLFGCFAEDFLGLRLISDAFRNAVFSFGIYNADERDLGFVGMIRPKLFTSEPSYVATFFVLVSTLWLILNDSKMKYLKYLGLIFVGLVLIGSPMILIAVVNGAIVYFFQKKGGSWELIPVKYSVVFFVGVIVTVIMLSTALETRFDKVISGRDDSFTIRIVAPIYISLEVLGKSPFWGSGISSTESIQEQIVSGAIKSRLVGVDPTSLDRVQNTFWMVWIFLGGLGGALFFWVMINFVRSFEIGQLPLCWALLIMLTQAGLGAFYAPRFWVYMMLLIAVLEIADREQGARR